MNKQELNDKLLNASHQGDLNTVKYLLSSPDLKEHANINYKDDIGWNPLMCACIKGNLEIIKYLLSSPELKEHANIHDVDDIGKNALMHAASEGHLEIVKYLLTSPELKEYADINYKDKTDENVLMLSCTYEHLEITEYLIIGMNVEVDIETMNWLQGENHKKEIYHDVLKLIKSRDLHDKLDNSIRDDKIDSKKVKL